MATLTIRNLPDDVRDKLRVRAARNGRSMEAEVRHVLEKDLQAVALDGEERRRRVQAVQNAFAPYRVPGVLASEELIAERRLEAWGETVEGMHDIQQRGGPVDPAVVSERAERARRRT